jgi:hypothetical protein
MIKDLAMPAMLQPTPTLPLEKEDSKSATEWLVSLTLTLIDALVSMIHFAVLHRLPRR